MHDHDEMTAAIERCLDGDLDREERLRLFESMVAAPHAQVVAAQVVALEHRLAAVAEAYRQVEPSPAFASAALRPPVRVRARPGFWQDAVDVLRHPVARHAWSSLAGAAVAAAVLIMVVLPARDARFAERTLASLVERVQVLDVPFLTVADAGDWTHAVHLEPGQSARIEVQQSHEHPFHLRIAGAGDVDVTLAHSRPHAADELRHIRGGPVHYAVLPGPQQGDVLVVRNLGNAAVDVHVAAPNKEAVTLQRPAAGARG